MVLVVSAPRVVAPGGLLAPGAVAVENGRIAGVAEGTGYAGHRADVALPDGVLAPGLVDLQVNGCFGVDLAVADRRGWERVVRLLPRTGVTAFLPTLSPPPSRCSRTPCGGPRRCSPGRRAAGRAC
ncbi:MAG TPA: hypothetical protein VKP11_00970, partial [Frankiaceae bacterium]|nr:hypothetical protein [Frankiaceae bacterium]